jgi:hypothetical protein
MTEHLLDRFVRESPQLSPEEKRAVVSTVVTAGSGAESILFHRIFVIASCLGDVDVTTNYSVKFNIDTGRYVTDRRITVVPAPLFEKLKQGWVHFALILADRLSTQFESVIVNGSSIVLDASVGMDVTIGLATAGFNARILKVSPRTVSPAHVSRSPRYMEGLSSDDAPKLAALRDLPSSAVSSAAVTTNVAAATLAETPSKPAQTETSTKQTETSSTTPTMTTTIPATTTTTCSVQ